MCLNVTGPRLTLIMTVYVLVLILMTAPEEDVND